MGVLDLFSGTPGRNTAIWSAGTTAAGADKSRKYVQDYGKLSLADLDKGVATARGDVNTNYGAGANALAAGKTGALAALAPNAGIIRNAASTADSYYAPLATEANRGYSAYGDAAGTNGVAGQDRARDNFRAGPGYEWTCSPPLAFHCATKSIASSLERGLTPIRMPPSRMPAS